MNRPYSEATIELVADAVAQATLSPAIEGTRRHARLVLDALAAAGLLLPEGAETPTSLTSAINLLADEERFVTWYRLNFDRLNEINDDMTYAATVRYYLGDVAAGRERLAPERRPCGTCGSVGPCRCDIEADEIATGGY